MQNAVLNGAKRSSKHSFLKSFERFTLAKVVPKTCFLWLKLPKK